MSPLSKAVTGTTTCPGGGRDAGNKAHMPVRNVTSVMIGDRSGRATSGNLGVLAIALVVVAGTVIGGMVVAGNAAPTGEEVLEDARDRYDAAENVAGTANVTVEVDDGSVERSAEVTFALTDDTDSRVAVTAANRTVVTGSNGSVGWIHLREAGLTRIVNLSDGSGAWSGPGTIGARPGGSVGPSTAVTSEIRERYEGLVPFEAWNASKGLIPIEAWNASQVRNRSATELPWARTVENVTAERLGTETVDGTEAHLVEIEAPGDREGTLRVWVGSEDATVLQSRFARRNLTVTVRYSDVRFNTSIADSTFRPPGARTGENTVVESREELQAATAFDVPVPSGAYAFASGSTVTYGDATVAVGSYTGPANATVVATDADDLPIDGVPTAETNATEIDLSGETAAVADTDRGVVVSWETDGVRTAVISEDSREAAISVAESIVGKK